MATKRKAQKNRRTRSAPKAVPRLPDLDQAKAAVLNSLSSPDAQRGYRHAIDEFVEWYCSEPRLSFSRAVVLRYRMHLESRNLAPGTINLRLGAVRRLAYEAADCGLLSPDLAAGIRRVKGVKKLGVRLGNWLTAEQATTLWQTPPEDTLKGKRDRALLVVLLACGLRRHEAVSLEMRHIQQREEHWAIIDLHGKAGHTRTVPIPDWAKAVLDRWTDAANITSGRVFRRVNKAGGAWGTGMPRRWCSTSSGSMRQLPGSHRSRPTISVAAAPGCATRLAGNWTRSSFCSGMSQSRRLNAISAASSGYGQRSTTGLALSRVADGSRGGHT